MPEDEEDAGGLCAQLLLQQAREAARLYEEAKARPELAQAAEARARTLTRGVAANIQAQILREEDFAKRKAADAFARASRDRGVRGGGGHAEANEAHRVVYGSGVVISGEPLKEHQNDYDKPVVAARGVETLSGLAAATEVEEACPAVSATKVEPSSLSEKNSSSRSVMSAAGINRKEDEPSLPARGKRGDRLDYRRFDAICAAELQSSSDDDTDWSASADRVKKLKNRDLGMMAHKMAGLIENMKTTPSCSSVAPPSPHTGASTEKQPAQVATPPPQDVARFRARYSVDYTRFSTVAGEGEESDLEKPYEDGPFSRRTIAALEACEAELAALDHSKEDFEPSELDALD